MKSVKKHLGGRPLRIATMCSGTESPLLALEMIRRSIEAQYGVNLGVEHVFSCEIEPFKQAYIERNFHPPLLFRDVCELGNDEAYVLCSRPSSPIHDLTDIRRTGPWHPFQGMSIFWSLEPPVSTIPT